MTIVLGDRRSGKTTELIKLANKHDIPVVVLDRYMLESVKLYCNREQVKIPKVITIDNLLNGWAIGKNIDKGFLFDNMEMLFTICLRKLSNLNKIPNLIAGFSIDTTDDTIFLPDMKERLREYYHGDAKKNIDRCIEMERRIK